MTTTESHPAVEASGYRRRTDVLAVAAGIAAGAGVLFAGNLPAVVMVCAAIYLLAAVTGRPGAAWIGFLASVPAIGLGRILQNPAVPLVLIAGACLVLLVVAAVRRSTRTRSTVLQVVGVVVFSGVAVAAALSSPTLAGILIVAGLLAHAGWDVWHHRARSVVSPRYALFCGALDVVLAVAVLVASVVGAP